MTYRMLRQYFELTLMSLFVFWQHALSRRQGEIGGWFLVAFGATEDVEFVGRRIVIGDQILVSMLGLCVRRQQRSGLGFVRKEIACVDLMISGFAGGDSLSTFEQCPVTRSASATSATVIGLESLGISRYSQILLFDSLDRAVARGLGMSSQSISSRLFHLLNILAHLFSQHGSGPYNLSTTAFDVSHSANS
jgi:hypothetical protein